LSGIIKYRQSVLFVLVIISLAAVTQSLAQKEAGSANAFDQILKSGQVLSRIYFEANNSKLGPEAKKELDRQARELSKMSGSFIVRIEGYTDSYFEREKDILLSMQRAQAAKLYILEKQQQYEKTQAYYSAQQQGQVSGPAMGQQMAAQQAAAQNPTLIAQQKLQQGVQQGLYQQ